MTSKYCRRCEQDLPITNFWRNGQSNDGLSHVCKKCRIRTQLGYFESRLPRSGRVREPRDPVERFWEKVKKSDSDNDCWLWTGTICKRLGLPRFGYKRDGRWYRADTAHRFSFQLHNPDIEMSKYCAVRHTCENKLCVNPAHLIMDEPPDAELVALREELRQKRREVADLQMQIKTHSTAFHR